MSRYYGYVLITFMDGETARDGGNRYDLDKDVLSVYTIDSTGFKTDRHNYPIGNIREWRWEKE